MKITMKFLVLFFGVLILANIANAESSREQLKQMVEQLQKNPSDDALREKIIKLAQELKPAPAVPEEAIKYEGRAKFAFKNAKSSADYIDAAEEYEKAVAAAPWVTGYYSDLCTIHEKAGIYVEAKRNCEFYLLDVHDPAESDQTKGRIAGLDYAIEKYSQAIQSNMSEPYDAALSNYKSNSYNLDAYYNDPHDFPVGNRYFCYAEKHYNDDRRFETWVVVNGSTVKMLSVVWFGSQNLAEHWRRGMSHVKNPSLQYQDLHHDGELIKRRYKIADDRSKVDLWESMMDREYHYQCVPK